MDRRDRHNRSTGQQSRSGLLDCKRVIRRAHCNRKRCTRSSEGLLDYLQGAKTPIVYIPLIVQNSDYRELLREYEQALVMLTGEVQVENILGDENVNVSGELTRVATLTLQEVI